MIFALGVIAKLVNHGSAEVVSVCASVVTNTNQRIRKLDLRHWPFRQMIIHQPFPLTFKALGYLAMNECEHFAFITHQGLARFGVSVPTGFATSAVADFNRRIK